jgi:hypothetical protein
MSPYKPIGRGNVRFNEAEMTFVEIARALGYRDPEDRGKKAVFMLYASALRKLRSRPLAFRRLLELSSERQRLINPGGGEA